jgi:hypothetical protein
MSVRLTFVSKAKKCYALTKVSRITFGETMKKLIALINSIKIIKLVGIAAGAGALIFVAALLFGVAFNQGSSAIKVGEMLGTAMAWFVKILVVLLVLKLIARLTTRRKPAEQ